MKGQQMKGQYFRALKAAGVTFEKHYRDYTEAELRTIYEGMVVQPELDGGLEEQQPQQAAQGAVSRPPAPRAPVGPRNPEEMPGQRQNTLREDEPLRIDPETGFAWYQEEVQKPAYPKPRGRRVLQYMESGVEEKTIQDGQYIETFEVAGRGVKVPAEVKITLPSYQVGIYKDPRFPFKIHTYNGLQGFDLFEVQDYYGGAEMVPDSVKRIYVEGSLCYDMRTVIRDIQTQYRQLQLQGKA